MSEKSLQEVLELKTGDERGDKPGKAGGQDSIISEILKTVCINIVLFVGPALIINDTADYGSFGMATGMFVFFGFILCLVYNTIMLFYNLAQDYKKRSLVNIVMVLLQVTLLVIFFSF